MPWKSINWVFVFISNEDDLACLNIVYFCLKGDLQRVVMKFSLALSELCIVGPGDQTVCPNPEPLCAYHLSQITV